MKWKNKQFMVLNKITSDFRHNVKTFFDLVDLHFSFLKKYGYRVKETRLATQYSVSNIVEVIFENTDLERIIVLHYEPNDLDGNAVHLISVSLFNRIKNQNKELELGLYIKKYKPELDIEHLKYPMKNYNGNFEESINKSLSGFAYFLKDEGINLIKGSEWEDGLFYDWSSAEKILYKEQKKNLGNSDDR